MSIKDCRVHPDFSSQDVNVLYIDLEIVTGIFSKQSKGDWISVDFEFYTHLVEQVPIY